MKMTQWLSKTNGRGEVVGVAYLAIASGNTRKQMFVNAIRTFKEYCANTNAKKLLFSKREFLLSNSSDPGHQFKQTEYMIYKVGTNWEIHELNTNWNPNRTNGPVFFYIYKIPNAKVNHPFAVDFMVKP